MEIQNRSEDFIKTIYVKQSFRVLGFPPPPFKLQFPRFDSKESTCTFGCTACMTITTSSASSEKPKVRGKERNQNKTRSPCRHNTCRTFGNHLHLHLKRTSEPGYLHSIILIKNKREFHVRLQMINCHCQKLICLKQLSKTRNNTSQ